MDTEASRRLQYRLPVRLAFQITSRFTAAIRGGATTPAAVVRAVTEQARTSEKEADRALLNAMLAHPGEALAFALYTLNPPPKAPPGPPSPAQRRTLTRMGRPIPETSAQAVKAISEGRGGWGKSR